MSWSRRGTHRAPFDLARPHLARRVGVAVAAVALAVVFATAWFDRSELRRLDLGTPAVLAIENRAGPVEVVEGDGPVVVEVAESYLAVGPEVRSAAEGDRTSIEVSCPGSWPCRAAATVAVPPGTAVEVVAPDHPVAAGGLAGPLTVTAGDGPVAIGPVSGPLRVASAAGAVRASGLRSDDVDIEAGSGPVELAFAGLPGQVSVTAGEGPVRLTLPDTVYRLDLAGQPVDAGGLEPAPSASRSVTVRSTGPVTLTTVPAGA